MWLFVNEWINYKRRIPLEFSFFFFFKTMTEDLLRRTLQRGGCRLCMAPDTECVPIFATAAADKEPLSSKILACVNIKVSSA